MFSMPDYIADSCEGYRLGIVIVHVFGNKPHSVLCIKILVRYTIAIYGMTEKFASLIKRLLTLGLMNKQGLFYYE